MSRRTRRLFVYGAIVAALSWLAAPYVIAAAFVLDLAGADGWARRLLPVRTRPVTTQDVVVPTRHGPLDARVYRGEGGDARSLIVFPGIHAGGLDEPRLVAFSRRLAATAAVVLSVPLPDLREFRITTRTTDMIEDATAWMAATPSLAPSGRVGLAGVSFAGGLALVAAGRPSLRDKLQMVVSLGGHGDLPRTMVYLCTGEGGGDAGPPHDYGLAILLLAAVDRLVPGTQADALRREVMALLHAASADRLDPAAARRQADAVRARAQSLAEPARTYLEWIADHDVAAIGRVLQPHIEAIGGDPALSPDRSPATDAPVFLLHGSADTVIPAEESRLAAQALAARGNRRVRLLVTPMLSHADPTAGRPAAETWRMIAFWRAVLAAAK